MIGSCVSESCPSMSVMYGLWLFIVVLQELHCLSTFWYVYALVFTDSTKFCASIQCFEICELKLKSNNNNKMKNCENKLSASPILVIKFFRIPIF